MLELEAPANCLPRLLQGDHDRPEQHKRDNDAGCKSESQLENSFGILAGLLDKAQNLDRDHRKHARHEIENKSTDECHQQVSRHPDRLLWGAGNLEVLIQNVTGYWMRSCTWLYRTRKRSFVAYLRKLVAVVRLGLFALRGHRQEQGQVRSSRNASLFAGEPLHFRPELERLTCQHGPGWSNLRSYDSMVLVPIRDNARFVEALWALPTKRSGFESSGQAPLDACGHSGLAA